MKLRVFFQLFASVIGLSSAGLFGLIQPAQNVTAPTDATLAEKVNETATYDDQNAIDFSQLDSVSAYTVAGPNNPLNVYAAN